MTDTQLAFPVDATPEDPHADARRHVVTAIATAAELHAGHVSPNEVRHILASMPEWQVPSYVVGHVYRALRNSGRLVEAGAERSDDTKSGNAGRLVPTYRWVDAP